MSQFMSSSGIYYPDEHHVRGDASAVGCGEGLEYVWRAETRIVGGYERK